MAARAAQDPLRDAEQLDDALGRLAVATWPMATASGGVGGNVRRDRATAARAGPTDCGAAPLRPRGEDAAAGRPRGRSSRPAATRLTQRTTGPPATAGQLVRVHQAAARFFRGQLRASWAPGYLSNRGFDAVTQNRWLAGYAPAGGAALTRHLRAHGYADAVIEAAGLARRSRRGALVDTFRDRAMLPIRDSDGAIVAFIGRAPDRARPSVPKYFNSPRTVLYSKREVLFGLWEARGLFADGARPVLVEGPLDVIAVTAAGSDRFAGVAPCGTALTGEHVAALGRLCDLQATGVIVAFDPDQAGRKAAVAAYHLLSSVTGGVAWASAVSGQDPADLLRDEGPAALADVLAERTCPLADLVVDAQVDGWRRWLCYPEGQFNALRAAAPVIAAMPPGHVARQVARLSGRLGLDHPTVTEAVTDALTGLVTCPNPVRPG